MSTESIGDEYARNGVTESLVESVADELNDRLDSNYGDTINIRNKQRFAKEAGFEGTLTNRIGMVFGELEHRPRYGIVVEQVNPGATKSSWAITRGDGA